MIVQFQLEVDNNQTTAMLHTHLNHILNAAQVWEEFLPG